MLEPLTTDDILTLGALYGRSPICLALRGRRVVDSCREQAERERQRKAIEAAWAERERQRKAIEAAWAERERQRKAIEDILGESRPDYGASAERSRAVREDLAIRNCHGTLIGIAPDPMPGPGRCGCNTPDGKAPVRSKPVLPGVVS